MLKRAFKVLPCEKSQKCNIKTENKMMKPKTEKSGKIYNAALVLSSNVYNVEINAFIFRRKNI